MTQSVYRYTDAKVLRAYMEKNGIDPFIRLPSKLKIKMMEDTGFSATMIRNTLADIRRNNH
jgi:hypothetical protein